MMVNRTCLTFCVCARVYMSLIIKPAGCERIHKYIRVFCISDFSFTINFCFNFACVCVVVCVCVF